MVRKSTSLLLLILAGYEMLFGFWCAVRAYALEPVFMRAFAVSTFTHEQRQFYNRFVSGNQSQWLIVILFGVVTLVLGVILLRTTGTRADASPGAEANRR